MSRKLNKLLSKAEQELERANDKRPTPWSIIVLEHGEKLLHTSPAPAWIIHLADTSNVITSHNPPVDHHHAADHAAEYTDDE